MLVSKAICDGLSDLDLIRKSQAQVDYFSCLYQRYEAQLLRYIRRLSHLSDAEAEDILQESFIKIWKNLNGFDQSFKLSTWIYRIVHNEVISCLRRKSSYGKDRTLSIEEGRYTGDPAEMPDEEKQDGDPDPEAHIREVLDQLQLPYKEVLVLKFLENMSYTEISDVLKIPEGTVATRINRAKKAFAALSEKQHIVFEL